MNTRNPWKPFISGVPGISECYTSTLCYIGDLGFMEKLIGDFKVLDNTVRIEQNFTLQRFGNYGKEYINNEGFNKESVET